MKQWMLARVTGFRTVALLVLSNTVFAIMLLITLPALESFSQGLKIFDVMPTGYDHEYASKLLEALGGPGRDYYLSVQLPLDLLYPLLYALANSFLFLYLIKKMELASKWFSIIYVLPLVAACFDYMENGCIAWMLLQAEILEPWHVSMSSLFTLLKSVSTTLYFILLISFFIAHLIRKSKHEQLSK